MAAQVAPAIALQDPTRQVLLLDLSVHADSSIVTLGGTDVEGQHCVGQNVINGLGKGVTSVGFLEAAQERLIREAGSAIKSPLQRGFGWPGISRRAAPAPQNHAFEWQDHAVRVASFHPSGGAPANLWVSPGGYQLLNLVNEGNVGSYSAALRRAFAAMEPANVVVLIDTDAELSERSATVVGVAASSEIAMVTTPYFLDYARLMFLDPVNTVVNCLHWLHGADTDFRSKIRTVIINKINSKANKPCVLDVGTSAAQSFICTPSNDTKERIEKIIRDLYDRCVNDNLQVYFEGTAGFADINAFTDRFITGLASVPDSVWQTCTDVGSPVVVKASEQHASEEFHNLARRILA